MVSSNSPFDYAIGWRIFYMTAMSIACLAVFFVSLWPKFDKPKYRVLRGTLFVILGLLGIVPFVHYTFM